MPFDAIHWSDLGGTARTSKRSWRILAFANGGSKGFALSGSRAAPWRGLGTSPSLFTASTRAATTETPRPRPANLSHSASPIGKHNVIIPRRASQIPCASISKKNSSFNFASLFAASAGERIGPRVVCTASIEPMPVNCTGASAARHKRVQPLPQRIAARVQRARRVRRVNLGQPDKPGVHRQHVVVECSRVRQSVRPPRIEQIHDVAAAAERAERHAATDIFPECRQIRFDRRAPTATRRAPAGTSSPRPESTARRLVAFPRAASTGTPGSAAMQPPLPIIGSRITTARSAACSAISDRVASGIVVGRHHVVERRVDRRSAAGEAEYRAVIAAIEHHHLLAPGENPRQRDRQQVRLGAGVGEPHPLQRRTARTPRGRTAPRPCWRRRN